MLSSWTIRNDVVTFFLHEHFDGNDDFVLINNIELTLLHK